jgi:transglutaminase-like putative cysteine protease
MTFARLYRASFYVMLFLATLALSVDAAADNPLVPIYPIGVAVAGVVAFFTVDRDPRRGLPPELANLLAFASVALFLLEWGRDDSQLVLALGHWLVYLQLVKMFRPKTVEDDWFLLLLGLTQVVVGAFQPGDYVGVVLVVWAVAALWTMRLFHLQREVERGGRAALADPYPGLVDRPFILSIGRVALLTLLLGGLIFLVMPRWDNFRGRRFRPQAMPQHLTGFSDTVKLGQMGEILENDTVVMSVELYDELDDPVEPTDEPLWRGVALQLYDRGHWERLEPRGLELGRPGMPDTTPARFLRQRIKLEPSDTEILFGLRPISTARGPELGLNIRDGSLFRLDLRPIQWFLVPRNNHPGAFDYTVISSTEAGAGQPFELAPSQADLRRMREVPANLAPTLREIVDRELAGVPNDPVSRARALESYLRDGEFRYTLQQTVVDRSMDPVADFLINRKSGHCEYFASALALLLRSAGIPSRMVNGFKGGDWNALAGLYYVRQKHAHSWVEALVSREGQDRPLWLTLDPTPPFQRDETVAQVGNPVGRRFRTLTDFFRYIWVFYFVGFDAARQEALIYGPVRALLNAARGGAAALWGHAVAAVRWMLDFPSVGSFFSGRGFVVSFTLLTLLALGSRLLRWLARRLGWGRRRADEANPDLAHAVASYRRLMQLMAGVGLRRPPWETPREFARRATELLHARGPAVAGAAGVPSLIVEGFYRVRYGQRALGEPEIREMESGLEALETSLRPPVA